MKIRNLDVGLESITRVGLEQDVHLPKEGPVGPKFLPQARPLDHVLRRPSLEERLPELLEPSGLDPALLEPSVLTEARLASATFLEEAARRATGHRRRILDQAAQLVDEDALLDEEVRAALAVLFRA